MEERANLTRRMARPTRFERVASTFGGWRSIQLSYGRIDIQIVSEIDHGQSRMLESTWLKRRGLKPRRSSPFVLHNLLSVCFRGASATSNAIFVLPSSFANRLVSLVFYDTLDHQKELAFAFGGRLLCYCSCFVDDLYPVSFHFKRAIYSSICYL